MADRFEDVVQHQVGGWHKFTLLVGRVVSQVRRLSKQNEYELLFASQKLYPLLIA